MALKIRLRRMGRKKAPHYRIVVAESTMPRDGRFVAKVGHYNPTTEPMTLVVDREKALGWMEKGATPTDTVNALFRRAGVYSGEPRLTDAVAGAARKAGQAAASAAGTVADAAKDAASAVADTAKDAASAVADAAKDASAAVADAAKDAVEAVAERVSGGEAEAPAAEAEATEPAAEATSPAEAADEEKQG